MLNRIDGSCYIDLIHSGLQNLEKNREILNDLNVFPVPDGDTGTNMVMTLRYGYDSVSGQTGPLSEIARKFSTSAVFGARGNSGVIFSQFFKGMSAAFETEEEADCALLAKALKCGCEFAYASVSQPTEGTMLTVLREASAAVAEALPLADISEAIDIFLSEAKLSLARTPELLPILKKANVVDSGGNGVVDFFEGMSSFLKGEAIEKAAQEHECEYIDFSLFDKNTCFDYGYCVEGLIQLRMDGAQLDDHAFKERLAVCGDSAVLSLVGDKLKLHIHVKNLGDLMYCCQEIGEFLTVKIENMSVQNLQKEKKRADAKKILCRSDAEGLDYSVVAVAGNADMQERLLEMGADVVILSEIAPSAQDFTEAFRLCKAKNILVFPNSANSIQTTRQAGNLHRDARTEIVETRSLAECYAVLSVLDFEGTFEKAVSLAARVLSGMDQFSVYRASKDTVFGNAHIEKDAYFALCKNQLLDVSFRLDDLVLDLFRTYLQRREYDVITLFYGSSLSEDAVEELIEKMEALGCDAEIVSLPTFDIIYEMTVLFE